MSAGARFGSDRSGLPLRVLWLTVGLGPGGVERLIVTHAGVGDCVRFSYRAAYLRPDKSHLVPELESLGVPVSCLRAWHVYDLRWAWRLRRLLRFEPVDVLHVQSPAVAAVARLAARSIRPRPRVVYTEHNTWGSYGIMTRWANRLTIGLDDLDVAVSEEVRVSAAPRATRRMRTVVHGVDVDAVGALRVQRYAVRAELGISAHEVVIGTIANYRVAKDYPNLLAAARSVLDQVPEARFVCVGQGPLEAQIKAEHARLGLGGRFALLGYRSDATRVMAAFDVFTLASRFEGLPVTLMEARALGVPVVVTRVGGMAAHVVDGIDGFLVEPGDADGLAAALVRLVADPALRDRMGQQSRAAAARFDSRVAVAALEAGYLEAVATVR